MTMQQKKTWSGRFNEPVAELVKRYTASVGFDQWLGLVDIQGSLAHAQMLEACGIIAAQDLADIQRGMAQIEQEIISGKFHWSLDLEDVHKCSMEAFPPKLSVGGALHQLSLQP